MVSKAHATTFTEYAQGVLRMRLVQRAKTVSPVENLLLACETSADLRKPVSRWLFAGQDNYWQSHPLHQRFCESPPRV